jgi:hypothetical protein
LLYALELIYVKNGIEITGSEVCDNKFEQKVRQKDMVRYIMIFIGKWERDLTLSLIANIPRIRISRS